ncbi:MAG TPA: glycosyltransferase family 39 protein [Desulfatirhabdiaceae bacterium]|nr:glycosyltransferase family 39 protein [Desulfatirhabdiaceae bacterium]
MTRPESTPRLFSPACLLILLAGVAIRLFMAMNTVIVNPDGILYIHQARSIYHGHWQDLTSCGLTFISGYPFLIAGMYAILSDWIWSARLVSVLLGSLTLIPLYGILRRFLDEIPGLLCLLMVALTPVLVSNSAEVVREPMMWCFGVTGLYLILRFLEFRKNWQPVIACVCFILASWARVEAGLLILSTIVYFLIWHKPNRIQALFWFVLPGIIAVLIVMASAWGLGLSVQQSFRGNEIAEKCLTPMAPYESLRTELRDVARNLNASPILARFLPEVRNFIWLVALGTLINRIMEAFFYPFVIFYLAGLNRAKKRFRDDPGIIYLILVSVMGLVLLYVHTLQTWMIYYRFLGMVMFSSAVLAGFGIDRILGYLKTRFHLTPDQAMIVMILIILAAGIPKNLKPPDSDKAVFVEIGRTISDRHPQNEITAVATSRHTQQWISFYANPHVSIGSCPGDETFQWERFPNHPLYFYIYSRQQQVKFVLWEERNWPDRFFPVDELVNSRFFQIIGTWHHPDTGKMILFEVKK